MFFWYLNALRTLIAVCFYAMQIGPPITCDRVWDMPPSSHLPPGKTYEEWYGSFALDCPGPHRDGS